MTWGESQRNRENNRKRESGHEDSSLKRKKTMDLKPADRAYIMKWNSVWQKAEKFKWQGIGFAFRYYPNFLCDLGQIISALWVSGFSYVKWEQLYLPYLPMEDCIIDPILCPFLCLCHLTHFFNERSGVYLLCIGSGFDHITCFGKFDDVEVTVSHLWAQGLRCIIVSSSCISTLTMKIPHGSGMRMRNVWSTTTSSLDQATLSMPQTHDWAQLRLANAQQIYSLEINNKCFKPLSFGVVCYTVIINWYDNS